MKSALLVLAVVGCAAPRRPMRPPLSLELPRVDKVRLPAMTTLEPRTWKVGQWAFYARTRNGQASGFERISVINADSCGLWIELAISERGMRTWTMCLKGTELQVVIERNDRGPPRVLDFRKDPTERPAYRWLVEQLTPHWYESLPREDVAVFAGKFAQAFKTEPAGGTRWSHPAVPFDGRVKFRAEDDSFRDSLVAFGDTGAANQLTELVVDQNTVEPVRLFYGLGVGVGGRVSVSGMIGTPVTNQLDLVARGQVTGYAGDDESSTLFDIGLRWFPWSFLYGRTSLGYTLLEQPSEENRTSADGLGLSAGIGFVAHGGASWRLIYELADHIGIYNAGVGIRHDLGLHIYLQVW